MRLDKWLNDLKICSRRESGKYIKQHRIVVNDVVMTNGKQHISPETDTITIDGEARRSYERDLYYIMHKPAGVVTATTDRMHETVIDLIADEDNRKDLFPVGRLDKDTEGLLVITNDGPLAHRLLSPKKHIEKVYYARIDGEVTAADVKTFEEGVVINEEFTAQPAKLNVLTSGEGVSEVEITVYEGKFHQVKRMFIAVEKEVTYLKRIKMGGFDLPADLELGEYRHLTAEEMGQLEGK
ncbi:pseudouridine synthase [Brochothrix thermosphacta]|uniref:pseudouridine synthase n=1 Tax=Brochothrix thermosphacta TaxID=2756 RepID=UPI000EBA2A59|nr:16S rRNA pseudouridine(516) synthase [Brochothrix thermosphacta]HCZ38004.1 16S rRNA pseudouridine(516) synthase [Brochothrix thermosphacta]HCZ46502.1 16S rRNA pseudouridine(516) synthase [Brochothrix thermosphacta]